MSTVIEDTYATEQLIKAQDNYRLFLLTGNLGLYYTSLTHLSNSTYNKDVLDYRLLPQREDSRKSSETIQEAAARVENDFNVANEKFRKSISR